MGLHKYKSIIDLFEKYLYQDLEALYEMDVGEQQPQRLVIFNIYVLINPSILSFFFHIRMHVQFV